MHRDEIPGADIVANPGCYPTAALLALAPLAREGLIDDVVIDAKSGVSGAGREPTRTTHYISADENMTPYKVEGHRHTPEIEQELGGLGNDVTVTFIPHLVPLAQGELVSCYVRPARDVDDADLAELYDAAYAREPWVELRLGAPGVIEVRDTNYCRLSVHVDSRAGRVIVFSALDNLWKGAASQAVQNLNLMFGLRRERGAPVTATTFHSRWVRDAGARDGVRGRAAGRLPRRGRGLRPEAERRAGSGAAGLRRARDRQRGALHALGRARRAGAAHAGALPRSTASAPWWPTAATRTPPPAGAGSRTPRACRAPPRWRR